MPPPRVHNRLRERRNAAEWTQLETARRVGITRQSLIHLESGKFVPSTTVALKLAHVFGCHVEDLFSLSTPATRLRAVLAASFSPPPSSERRRVVVGLVEGRWVAHRLHGEESVTLLADGVIEVGNGPRRRTVDVDALRPEAD